jgi:tetratricopeptide (TPR) repeat protein
MSTSRAEARGPGLPESPSAAGRETALAFLVAGFLALHLLARALDVSLAWGFDFLPFYPDWVTILFLALSVALFSPSLRGRVHLWFGRHPAALDFWQPGRSGVLRRMGLLMVLLAGFIVLRCATHLLGDGYLYVRELSLGESSTGAVPLRTAHEPALLWLVALSYRALGRLGWSAEATYRAFSLVAGLLYVIIAIQVAGDVARLRRMRLLILTLLLTPGSMLFFFGYVETYPLLMPATLLYLWLCLRALAGERSPWPAAGVLGLGITLHFTMLSLIPSFLVLLIVRNRERRRLGKRRDWAAAGIIPVLAGAILAILGFDLRSYLEAMRSDHLLPLISMPDFYQPYRLFAWSHLVDVLNELLLASPAAVLALPFILARRADPAPTGRGSTAGRHAPGATGLFLASAAASALLLTTLVNPEIGAFRDWDLLAIPALPLTLWAAVALGRALSGPLRCARAGLLIGGALGLHLLLWAGLNAREEAAVARYAACLERGALSQHARAYGWETLGTYFDRERSDPRRAAAAFARAIAADEDNPRYWNLAAVQHAAQGDYETAIAYLRRAIDMRGQPVPSDLNNLAVFYSEIGAHQQAVQCLEQVIRLQPERAEAHHNLGLALARAGRLQEAAGEFGRAAEIQPRDATVLRDLGMALVQLGRLSEAERVMRKLQSLDAGQPR